MCPFFLYDGASNAYDAFACLRDGVYFGMEIRGIREQRRVAHCCSRDWSMARVWPFPGINDSYAGVLTFVSSEFTVLSIPAPFA
jgi:hypothetical protein